MYVAPVYDLTLYGVENRGKPNEERVTLRAGGLHVDLAQYSLIVGYRPYEAAEPMRDYFFWMGDVRIDPASWVFVYTGAGQTRFTKTAGTNEPAYVVHWGHQFPLFTDSNIVPMLVKFSGVTIGRTNWLDSLPRVLSSGSQK